MNSNSRAESRSVSDSVLEVLRVALPLMVSTGTFSLVLFADRTMLLRYSGESMSASMAAGNLFWSIVCIPVGIASMTGAIVGQYVGAGEERRVGRFLWQSVWLAVLSIPFFFFIGWHAERLFQATGQPESLVPAEAIYLRMLLIGGAGVVLETALSGFFSGTERTGVIMWVSVASGMLNVGLDGLLIFGLDASWFSAANASGPRVLAYGIVGAGIASTIAFWFKAVCYAMLLLRARYRERYQIWAGRGLDLQLLGKLLYFGFPAGLMYLTEAGGFTTILLRIGALGDVPLRATTMAINFNMVAFIPLVGVSIAASVLVGRHLTESGPREALRAVLAALTIGWVYSGLWAVAYLLLADEMLSLFRWQDSSAGSLEALAIARYLLGFVALYVVLDATQLIVAGALRGAGDTWFVLIAGFLVSLIAVVVGIYGEPDKEPLHWWWWVVTGWVWMLATAMVLRFIQGRWKTMRMV